MFLPGGRHKSDVVLGVYVLASVQGARVPVTQSARDGDNVQDCSLHITVLFIADQECKYEN